MPGRRRRSTSGARSQHFLRRGALASSLVREIDFAATDCVVEIGAGSGALTAPLAERFARVCAVEIDCALCARLRRRFAGNARVEVIEADFSDFELPGGAYAVVGNLPFHCTSEVLGRLADAPNAPHDIVAIVEHRAAARHAGRPFAPEALRSLWLKVRWHVEITRGLPPRDFDPPPAVAAAVLWMARRPRPLVPRTLESAFRDFTAAHFAGPRLDVALRATFTRTQVRRLAADFAFPAQSAPSDLGLEQWLALFRSFRREVPRERRTTVRGARNRLPRASSLGRR